MFYPFLFEHVLIVGCYQTLDILHAFGTLLQNLTVCGTVWIALDAVYLCVFHSENVSVYKTVVAFLEDSLFHAYAQYGVVVESLAQNACPVVEGYLLYAFLNGFDVGFLLCVVGNAL